MTKDSYYSGIVPLKGQSIETVAAQLASLLSPYPEWAKPYNPTSEDQKPIIYLFTTDVSETTPAGAIEVNGQTLTLFKAPSFRSGLEIFEPCIMVHYILPIIDPMEPIYPPSISDSE